jgi:hypothetical protein
LLQPLTWWDDRTVSAEIVTARTRTTGIAEIARTFCNRLNGARWCPRRERDFVLVAAS